MSEEPNPVGAIVELLRDGGVLSHEQIRFAQRIRAKLSDPKSLVGILEERDTVSEEQIKAALRRRHLDVPLGGLLVEHHFVDERQLTELLASQLGLEFILPGKTDVDLAACSEVQKLRASEVVLAELEIRLEDAIQLSQ